LQAAVALLLCAAAAPSALALAGYGRDIPSVPGIDYERAARLRAAPPPPPPPPPAKSALPVGPPGGAAQPYSFAYDVVEPAAGLNYGQKEQSNGAGVVTGEYRVLLPDGRTQVVRYVTEKKKRMMKGGFFGYFLFMYVIQRCFSCRLSDPTVSEDAV